MRIALVTSSNVPSTETDDTFLVDALRTRGVNVEWHDWRQARDWDQFDSSLIRTTWDYHDHPTAFLTWAEQVPRLLPGTTTIRWNADKQYLRDLEAEGVSIVPTHWLDPNDALPAIRWSRPFLKPVIGANASGTLRLDTTDRDAIATHRAAHPGVFMLQPYLPSVERYGEVSVIMFNGHLSHAVRKVPRPGDYRVQDDHGGVDRPHVLDPAESAVADLTIAAAARRLGTMPLIARVDLLRDLDDRPCLNELELIEPSLFFRHAPDAADHLAAAVVERVKRGEFPS